MGTMSIRIVVSKCYGNNMWLSSCASSVYVCSDVLKFPRFQEMCLIFLVLYKISYTILKRVLLVYIFHFLFKFMSQTYLSCCVTCSSILFTLKINYFFFCLYCFHWHLASNYKPIKNNFDHDWILKLNYMNMNNKKIT